MTRPTSGPPSHPGGRCAADADRYSSDRELQGQVPSTVTIGLPFKSEPLRHFDLAVRSVFAQTHSDWKLVLLADGANEDLLRAARAVSDSRVSLLEHAQSRGLAAGLNVLADCSDTELLFRMDADDVMHPERVEKLSAFLDQRPDVDVVGSRLLMIDQHDAIQGLFREPVLPTEPAGFLVSNALSHPAVAGRTAWFTANPYDPSYLRAEDKELWARTSGDTVFAKLDEALMYYRVTTPLHAQKQAADSAWDRKVLARYGPQLLGRRRSAQLLIKSRFKQSLFTALTRTPLQSRLYDRKSEELPEVTRRDGFDQLERIRGTAVPGWDKPRETTRKR